MENARILIADCHTLVAEALRHLLGAHFEIVGIALNAGKLLTLALESRPAVILLDLPLATSEGMDAAAELKRLLPETGIIVLSTTDNCEITGFTLPRWASGYLLKQSTSAELVWAIQEVLSGRTYVSPGLNDRSSASGAQSAVPEKQLTPRQREVVQLLAEGRTMKEAGLLLGVAPRTIAFHKYKIMSDFGLPTTADLVRFAMRQSLVNELPVTGRTQMDVDTTFLAPGYVLETAETPYEPSVSTSTRSGLALTPVPEVPEPPGPKHAPATTSVPRRVSLPDSPVSSSPQQAFITPVETSATPLAGASSDNISASAKNKPAPGLLAEEANSGLPELS